MYIYFLGNNRDWCAVSNTLVFLPSTSEWDDYSQRTCKEVYGMGWSHLPDAHVCFRHQDDRQ